VQTLQKVLLLHPWVAFVLNNAHAFVTARHTNIYIGSEGAVDPNSRHCNPKCKLRNDSLLLTHMATVFVDKAPCAVPINRQQDVQLADLRDRLIKRAYEARTCLPDKSTNHMNTELAVLLYEGWVTKDGEHFKGVKEEAPLSTHVNVRKVMEECTGLFWSNYHTPSAAKTPLHFQGVKKWDEARMSWEDIVGQSMLAMKIDVKDCTRNVWPKGEVLGAWSAPKIIDSDWANAAEQVLQMPDAPKESGTKFGTARKQKVANAIIRTCGGGYRLNERSEQVRA
jgi:hypothetical protein